MQELAIQYVSLSESVLNALGYLMVVLGFLAGLFTWKSDIELRRAKYVLMTGMITFLLTSSQALWVIVTPETISSMFVATILTYLAGGYAQYIISRARSYHAYGHGGKAWMGIVPVLNLILMFEAKKSFGKEPRRSVLSRLCDPLIVVFGLLLAISGNVLISTLSSSFDQRMPSGSASTGMTPTEAATFMENNANVSFPMQVDEITVLTDIKAVGANLIYQYEINTDQSEISAAFHDTLRRNMCGPEGLREAIEYGVTIRMVYDRKSDMYRILDLPITEADCQALGL